MPWTWKSFKKKHNNSLTSTEARTASRVANDVLRRTGDEGHAIASGNAVVNNMRSGKPRPR